MRKIIPLFLVLSFLSACSDSLDSHSEKDAGYYDAPDGGVASYDSELSDRPAPPIATERFPVVELPGYEQPRDAGIFAARPSVGTTQSSSGLDAPESGQGEYASVGWNLPSSEHDAAPAETLPQIQEEQVNNHHEGQIIPHEQVIEDIPQPINIVEDIPLR